MQVVRVPNINSATSDIPRNTVVYEVLRKIHTSFKYFIEDLERKYLLAHSYNFKLYKK